MPTETTDTAEPSSSTEDELEDLPIEFVRAPTRTLDDVIGLKESIETLRMAVVDPLVDTDRRARTHGVLVHGPTGTGKTYVAESLVGELASEGFTVMHLGATLGGNTREIVDDIGTVLRSNAPSVLLADPFHDVIRTDVVTAFKQLLAALNATNDQVLVVATDTTTAHPQQTSPLFEDFEVKVAVDTPEVDRREELFATFLDSLTAADQVGFEPERVDLSAVAEVADEFGASQVRMACERAIHLTLASGDTSIAQATLEEAVTAVRDEIEEVSRSVQPGKSCRHAVESPEVSFEDIGGLDEQKQLLREYLTFADEYADLYDRLDIPRSRGVLLYGPPGNGKTMLAKAIATESDRAFFAVSGPELNGPYVGQTERRIRKVFSDARDAAPSVVFFDELDALAPNRAGVGQRGYKVDHVNTLLAELDGFRPDADVLVVAATNRKGAIDPAVLRPGRIGEHLEIQEPDVEGRLAVLEATLREYPLANDVTVEWLEKEIPRSVSAARLVGVCEKALHYAVRDFNGRNQEADAIKIGRAHFQRVISDQSKQEQDDEINGFL